MNYATVISLFSLFIFFLFAKDFIFLFFQIIIYERIFIFGYVQILIYIKQSFSSFYTFVMVFSSLRPLLCARRQVIYSIISSNGRLLLAHTEKYLIPLALCFSFFFKL